MTLRTEYEGLIPSPKKEEKKEDLSEQMSNLLSVPLSELEELEGQTGPEPDIRPDTLTPEFEPTPSGERPGAIAGPFNKWMEERALRKEVEDAHLKGGIWDTTRGYTVDPRTGLLTVSEEDREKQSLISTGEPLVFDEREAYRDPSKEKVRLIDLPEPRQPVPGYRTRSLYGGYGPEVQVASILTDEQILSVMPKAFHKSLKAQPWRLRELSNNMVEQAGAEHALYPRTIYNAAKAIGTGVTQGFDFTTDLIGWGGRSLAFLNVTTRGFGDKDHSIFEIVSASPKAASNLMNSIATTALSATLDAIFGQSNSIIEDDRREAFEEDVNSLRGPNAVYEVYNYLINDYAADITAGQGMSDFSKVFWPQVITDTISYGSQPAWDAIYKYLEIEPQDQSAALQALTFGSSMFGALTVPRGMWNIYKLGFVGKASRSLASTIATSKYGFPILQEGGKLYDFIKPIIQKHGPWGAERIMPTGKQVKKALLPRQEIALDAQIAIGSAGAYGFGDMLLHGTEFENAKYFLGMLGGIAATSKMGISMSRAPWRLWNAAIWIGSKGAAKTAKALGKKPIPGTIEGRANAFMYSFGYKKENILNLEQQAHSHLEVLKSKYAGEKNGLLKAEAEAIEMNLLIPDGKGGHKVNTDFYKVAVIEEALTAADRGHYMELGYALNKIDDPWFKRDLQVGMQRGEDLINRLAANVKGVDTQEKIAYLQATLVDTLQLSSVRNMLHHQMSKLELGLSGEIKKGKLINDIEKTQRQIDVRSEQIMLGLKELKLIENADEASVAIIGKLKEYVTNSIHSKVETQNFLRSQAAKFVGWVEGKYTRNTVKGRNARDKILRRGILHGTMRPDAAHKFMHKSEQTVFGEVGATNSYWKPYMDEGYKTFNKEGVFIVRKTEGDNLYQKLFALAEKGDTPLYLNASLLDDAQPFLHQMYDVRIGELIGDVAMTRMYVGNPKLRVILRERGLEELKRTSKRYPSKLRSLAQKYDIKYDPQADDFIATIEAGLKRFDGPIDGKDISQMLTLREWHGIRGNLMNKERMMYRNSDYDKFWQYKQAVQRFDKLYDESNISKSLTKAYTKAQQHYREKIVPYREHLARSWSRNDDSISSHPSMYFTSFYTKGGTDGMLAQRDHFDNLFMRSDGSYPEDVKDLMISALGRTIDTGKITADGVLPQMRAAWTGVLPEKVFKELDDFIALQNLHTKGTEGFSPAAKETMDNILNAVESIDKVQAAALANSAFGRLAGRIGEERLGVGEELSNYINAFRGARPELARAVLFDALFGTGQNFQVAQKFGISQESLRRTTAPIRDAVFPELTAQKTVEQGLRNLTQRAEDALPPVLETLEAGALEIIMSTPLGKDKKFVEMLRTLVIDELLVRNTKFNTDLLVTGMGHRAEHLGMFVAPQKYRELAKEGKAGVFAPVIELGMDLKIDGLRQFMKDHERVFQTLYMTDDAGKQQLQALHDLVETQILIKGQLHKLNIKGGVNGYTLPMALGRAYNVMKGVVSARYAFLEGGVILARQKQSELMMRIFTDPKAAQIIRQIFVNGDVRPAKLKTLGRVLFAGVGMELTHREMGIMTRLTYDIMNFIARNSPFQRRDVESIIKIREEERKERHRIPSRVGDPSKIMPAPYKSNFPKRTR